MIRGNYKLYLSEERNKYIIVRQNFPGLMIYVTLENDDYEISKMNFMENCSASELCKVLKEFDLYLKREIAQGIFMDDSNRAEIA